MYNIGNLPQIINSLNGMVLGIRSEIENLKNEVSALKNATTTHQQTQSTDTTGTSVGVEELETRITSIQTTLDSALASHTHNTKGIETKIDTLEKSLSDKVVSLHQIVNDKDNHRKQEVQTMIDQSIALLLDGLRPQTTTTTAPTHIHENPTFAPLTVIDEGDETPINCGDVPTTSEHHDETSQQTTDTPKPKGRGGRKKKVVATQ
jgi:Sec-independent protein translocase protein TatA